MVPKRSGPNNQRIGPGFSFAYFDIFTELPSVKRCLNGTTSQMDNTATSSSNYLGSQIV